MILYNKNWSVFITFYDIYFVEIEKDLYFCSVKNQCWQDKIN